MRRRLGTHRRVEGKEIAGRRLGTMHVSPESLVNGGDLLRAMASALHDSAAGYATRHALDLPGLLRESAQVGMWDGKALVLAIDELQSTEADAMPALRVLHVGLHGCPILLVGFGLQHTASVLAEPGGGVAGISRLSAPRSKPPSGTAC